MGEKRTGGIVAAVSLSMVAAFIAIAMLILTQNLNVAVRYAESTADLSATELSADLSTYVREQDALASSQLLDEELCAALSREDAGARREEVLAALDPILDRLVVDDQAGVAFLASSRTHVVYRSDGSTLGSQDKAVDTAWIEKMLVSPESKALGAFHVTDRSSLGDEEPVVLVGRALSDGDTPVGVLGVSVRTSALERLMHESCGTSGDEALCFDAGGSVLMSTDERIPVGSNAFGRVKVLASLSDDLDENPARRWTEWRGLDGLMPREQRLYAVRYLRDFDAYLLTVSSHESIFSAMRTRATVLVVSLVVVMVLLMLLLMTIVQWYRARLMQAATTDELTGLANRKSFVTSFERLVGSAAGAPMSLALIDVDRFKQVNDTYGHAGGDHALSAIAAVVRETATGGGLAGRWGGDEFICVVPAAGQEARALLEAMVSRVAALEFDEGFAVSVSVGSTQLAEGLTLEHAVEQADDALYVTKEGGRGFLTVYEPGVTPSASGKERTRGVEGAAPDAEVHARPQQRPDAPASAARTRGKTIAQTLVESLLYAVRKMVPFVAGGGVLIAVAFLIDGASVNVNALSAEARANFGSITPMASGMKELGSAAFNFMLPVFGAFFARGLAGEEAFMAGFAGGYLASQGGAGFVGTFCAALVASGVVRLMKNFMDETPLVVRRVAPVLLYPLFSLLIMYLLMRVAIAPAATAFEALLTRLLTHLQQGSPIALGAVCGALMATDMGGPINKSAYHFGLAAIAANHPEVMAAVMVGGMVPPCGVALCMVLFPNKFSGEERDQGIPTLVMGLSFITEGVIPFLLTDILRVIPSCMVGAALAGALSVAYDCTLLAPHGGIFVFPVVGHPLMYLMALAGGSLACAVMLGLLKRPVEQHA